MCRRRECAGGETTRVEHPVKKALAICVAVGVAVGACDATAPGSASGSASASASATGAPLAGSSGRSLHARCSAPGGASAGDAAGATSCSGFAIEDLEGGQTGWGADDLASAYNIPTTLPSSATIAILAGGYDPALESDLQVYRGRFGLPACTVENDCLRIVTSTGSKAFGSTGTRYEDVPESSLEVQVASAGCPHCKLLVVVATDDSSRTPTLPELAAAAVEAVALGATAMVTSYGASELDANGASWAAPYEKLFATAPQVPLFAAAGDGGYLDGRAPGSGVRVPAAFPEVVAVGGTALTQVPADVSPRRWTEAPLPTASSGCSASFAKPSWQTDSGCPTRMTNDLAASADGALVYFTAVDPGGDDQPGWHTEGGTGEAAALAAGIFAAAGRAYNGGPAFSYRNASYFNDITGGSNGSCGGSGAYQCSGEVGYDGPTGNGSPNGDVFQGTWLTLSAGSNEEVPRGASDGGELHTVGDWAQSCKALTFHATGLPEGVSATFGGESFFNGNPYVQFALSATLTAPLAANVRVTLVADCDGQMHTITVFLDVLPCRLATSCLATDGIPTLCGSTAPDGCGGTIACGTCNTIYTCTNGVCVAPPSMIGPGDH